MNNASLQQKRAQNQMDEKKTLHKKRAEKMASSFEKLKLVLLLFCR